MPRKESREKRKEKKAAYDHAYYMAHRKEICTRIREGQKNGTNNGLRNRALRLKYDEEYRQQKLEKDRIRRRKRILEKQAELEALKNNGQNEPT